MFDVDAAVRPQDDLFRHVNGPWLARTEIPADRAAWGAFMELRENAQGAVRDIITHMTDAAPTPGSIEARIADLYASFMDVDAVEARGLAGLPFDRIEAIDGRDALLDWFAFALRSGVTTLVTAGSDADPGEEDRYLLYVSQDGIGLPDEEYYRLPQHAGTLASYERLVARLLAAGGFDADAAGRVVALEARLAAHHWDKVRTRDLQQMYNLTAVADLAPEWRRVLTAAGAGSLGEVVVAQPSFLEGALAVVDEVPLADWRDWARFHLLKDRAHVLPAAVYDAHFDFYGRTLNGIPEQLPRWKRGVQLVEQHLGEAVGQVYVERHFPPAAKERMDALVAALVEAYRRSITSLAWMTDATRAEALAKLAAFRPKIGYPERWRDYSALTIDRDLLGNVQRGAEFAFDEEVAKASTPVRPWEWLMTPQTVNAYYHPFRNEIVFPAAILQPPFFDADADDAVIFGAIGAVIGHEIGHGFDDKGSTTDGQGRLRDWWTPADREAFAERTGRLVAQYAALSPEQTPDVRVNGELTLGENIGDLGGLGIAYEAWRLVTGGDVPPIDGLTGAQRLFYSWARAWESKLRDEAMRERVATDPHSPAEFRCNQVVKNLDAFHEAFATTPGDGLWLDPAERVRIW